MMKIHIMNLLQLVPNGDFPPPQSEANTRCCSAKVASINSLHLLSARFPKYGHVYALTRRFAAPSPRGRGTNLPNGPSPPGTARAKRKPARAKPQEKGRMRANTS